VSDVPKKLSEQIAEAVKAGCTIQIGDFGRYVGEPAEGIRIDVCGPMIRRGSLRGRELRLENVILFQAVEQASFDVIELAFEQLVGKVLARTAEEEGCESVIV
jgi:hypothetical protein